MSSFRKIPCFCSPSSNIRELKQQQSRRQRERQKRNRFRSAKQQLYTCITLFCTFLYRRGTTTTWPFLISRFVADVITRQQFPFSFPELRYSLLEFYSKKICQNLTNLSRWNERDKVWDIDCEQSLFFFRFSESNARAISHARGHLCVSRFDRRTTEKRETARSLFETGPIRFLSDVFAALAFVVA